MQGETELFEYIKERRRKRDQKVGLLYAKVCSDGVVRVGWSRVNISAGDIYDHQRASDIVLGRIESHKHPAPPQSIRKQYDYFYIRCKRYFKDKQVLAYA
jgi:hypothetical protein